MKSSSIPPWIPQLNRCACCCFFRIKIWPLLLCCGRLSLFLPPSLSLSLSVTSSLFLCLFLSLSVSFSLAFFISFSVSASLLLLIPFFLSFSFWLLLVKFRIKWKPLWFHFFFISLLSSFLTLYLSSISSPSLSLTPCVSLPWGIIMRERERERRDGKSNRPFVRLIIMCASIHYSLPRSLSFFCSGSGSFEIRISFLSPFSFSLFIPLSSFLSLAV